MEYEASMIDVPGVGKTSSCLGDGELWQNTVWGIDDFVSQEKFDFKYVLNAIQREIQWKSHCNP